MRYISLFTGIGGFEIAIHRRWPDAICLGYSEVDKFAIQVYEHHFPTHRNLGSVEDITEDQIRELVSVDGCDLIVGGFPCQNLSSLSSLTGNSEGLQGPKSGLFYNMMQIIDWIYKHNSVQLHLLAENNASMSKANTKLITNIISDHFDIPINMTMLNGADFGVQNRKRLYWTTFHISMDDIRCEQTWDDVLEPIEKCINHISNTFINNSCNDVYFQHPSEYSLIVEKCIDSKYYEFIKRPNPNNIGKTRWQHCSFHSDNGSCNLPCTYTAGKSRTITRTDSISNCLIDRRVSNYGNYFIIRHFTPIEKERLFWIPVGWVSNYCSKTRCSLLLGNTVVVRVIEYILEMLGKRSSGSYCKLPLVGN